MIFSLDGQANPVELRHLRTLVAIADYGGFGAAGAAIGLTQSAVSLHVKAWKRVWARYCSTAAGVRRC